MSRPRGQSASSPSPLGAVVRCLILAVAFSAAGSASLTAQAPTASGSAVGYGLGGLTEARGGDVPLWNPALGAIWDGPERSIQLLQVAGETHATMASYAYWQQLRGLSGSQTSIVDDRMDRGLSAWSHSVGASPVLSRSPQFGANASVQWLGLQARELTVSLTSYGSVAGTATPRALGIMRGDNAWISEPVTVTDLEDLAATGTREAAYSVLAVGLGRDHGVSPLLGRLWTGVTVKAAQVHHHSRGEFLYAQAADLVRDSLTGALRTHGVDAMPGEYGLRWRSLALDNTRIYSGDVGMVASPHPSTLISLTASNVIQRSRIHIGDRWLEEHVVDFAGRGSDGLPRTAGEVRNPPAPGDDPAWMERADALAAATRFTPMLKGAVSADFLLGRAILAYAHPLDNDPSLDRDDALRSTIAYAAPRLPMSPRASISRRLDGRRQVDVGLQRGVCGVRIQLGGGVVWGPDTSPVYRFSVGWGQGIAPCGLMR